MNESSVWWESKEAHVVEIGGVVLCSRRHMACQDTGAQQQLRAARAVRNAVATVFQARERRGGTG